jgi:drug/metabolite transporter (DMT)-like permease
MSPARQGHLAMLVFSALIAGSFSLGARVGDHITPIALNAVRFWLAALILLGLAVGQGRTMRPLVTATWRWAALGALYAAYFVFMFEGLKTAPPVSAAAVFTLTPLMAGGFGWLLLRQRFTGRMLVALAIGGAGALWVIFRGDLARIAAFDLGRGEAIYFIGCVAHAMYTPLFRRLNGGTPLVVAALGIVTAGGVILTVWGWPRLVATDWAHLPPIVWVTLLYTVLAATVGSTLLMQAGSLRLPSAKVMAYTYLTPVWVIGWEWALGAALPSAVVLGGVVLILLALALLLRDEPQAGG